MNINTPSAELEAYMTRLDQEAEEHVSQAVAELNNAYAIGLRRGFCEGFSLASIITIIGFALWRML